MQVRVVTGVPHYPTGRVQPGYRAAAVIDEVVDGIRVRRTPEYPDHSASTPRRMLNYLSWAVSATVFGMRHIRTADVTLVYSSPATAALPAMVGRALFGTPFVIQIQDLWPDSVFATGHAGPPMSWLRRPLLWATGRAYRSAARVCVISPGMASLLEARGVDRAKVSLVYNWVAGAEPVLTDQNRQTRRARGADGRPRLLYAGNHGPAQGLALLVEAVASCPDVELVLVGNGTEKEALIRLAEGARAENIQFLDRVDAAGVRALQRDADVQVISLRDDPLFEVTMPGKVQTILAAGMPVIAIASGDVAKAVESADCGWTVRPGDREALTRALGAVAGATDGECRRLGENGRAYYERHMGKAENVAALCKALEEAATER